MIVTAGTSGKGIFDYYDELFHTVETNGGEIYLVQVAADKQTIVKRVESDFRKRHGKHFGKDKLEESIIKYPEMFDKYPKKEHLTVDTQQLSPEEAARKILDYYKWAQ